MMAHKSRRRTYERVVAYKWAGHSTTRRAMGLGCLHELHPSDLKRIGL